MAIKILTKSKLLTFQVYFYETRWSCVQALSALLTPYRHPGSFHHRLVTGLFCSLLSETEYADKEFIEELQLRRLRRLLRKAEEIPWWKERFKKYGLETSNILSLQDIQKLPPVSKNNFLDIEREQLVRKFKYTDKRVLRHRTSGTTGIPFEWGIDKNVWLVEVTSYFYRALSWYGGYTRFKWFMIAALIYRSYSVPSKEIYWNPIGPRAQEDFLEVLKDLKQAMCSVLFSYPTNLLLFAKNYKNDQESISFKTIVTSGQRLEDEYRLYIEKKMGCPVATLYGAREFGQLGVECPGRNHRYHLNAERLLVEILDEQGNVLADGENGLITITGLDNTVMPLIRYQLGDEGKIIVGECSCGRKLPVVEFQGREMGFVLLSNGERVPFRHLNSIILNNYFENFTFYQVEQLDVKRLVFRYKLCDGVTSYFQESLAEDFKNYTKENMQIVFVEQQEELHGSSKKMSVFIPLSQ